MELHKTANKLANQDHLAGTPLDLREVVLLIIILGPAAWGLYQVLLSP